MLEEPCVKTSAGLCLNALTALYYCRLKSSVHTLILLSVFKQFAPHRRGLISEKILGVYKKYGSCMAGFKCNFCR